MPAEVGALTTYTDQTPCTQQKNSQNTNKNNARPDNCVSLEGTNTRATSRIEGFFGHL